MTDDELLKTRIKKLNDISNVSGKCVLYIMSRDQRVLDNHALLVAQKHAIARQLPLAVVFCVYDKVGNRAREQYRFMLQGLHHVESELKKLHIPFIMLFGSPQEKIQGIIHHTKPDAVYFDFSPLRTPQKIARSCAEENNVPIYIVDTHNMIPVWVASDKKEIGARTIRTKIHKKFAMYLEAPEDMQIHPHEWPGTVKTLDELSDYTNKMIDMQPANGTKLLFESGENEALKRLDKFTNTELSDYNEARNDPSNDALSDLSPYLHFGQLSSLRVALKMHQIANQSGADLHLLSSGKMPQAEDADNKKVASANALLEEMIVRKELSDNFCFYEKNYDSVEAADNWAKMTIKAHDDDPRDHLYSYDQLEQAKTHDPAWNASQRQLLQTGKMHGYMRMYWAKKIKEWTGDAETAIQFAVKLNDFYSLDGGDPNGYVGILWSVAGVHDRAWTEREIFGKIRYMNYGGLKRKFDITSYEKTWND